MRQSFSDKKTAARNASVKGLRQSWDTACLNIIILMNEVYDRLGGKSYETDEERENLEAMLEEMEAALDYEHVAEIARYVRRKRELKNDTD